MDVEARVMRFRMARAAIAAPTGVLGHLAGATAAAGPAAPTAAGSEILAYAGVANVVVIQLSGTEPTGGAGGSMPAALGR
jgi:hypothetical protein